MNYEERGAMEFLASLEEQQTFDDARADLFSATIQSNPAVEPSTPFEPGPDPGTANRLINAAACLTRARTRSGIRLIVIIGVAAGVANTLAGLGVLEAPNDVGVTVLAGAIAIASTALLASLPKCVLYFACMTILLTAFRTGIVGASLHSGWIMVGVFEAAIAFWFLHLAKRLDFVAGCALEADEESIQKLKTIHADALKLQHDVGAQLFEFKVLVSRFWSLKEQWLGGYSDGCLVLMSVSGGEFLVAFPQDVTIARVRGDSQMTHRLRVREREIPIAKMTDKDGHSILAWKSGDYFAQ